MFVFPCWFKRESISLLEICVSLFSLATQATGGRGHIALHGVGFGNTGT